MVPLIILIIRIILAFAALVIILLSALITEVYHIVRFTAFVQQGSKWNDDILQFAGRFLELNALVFAFLQIGTANMN